MKTLTPEKGMTTVRNEIDRLFDRLWEGDETPTLGAWTPKLDLSETKDSFTVKAEVPGIEPKEIQLTLENGYLTIRGEKHQEVEQKDERFYRAERTYGAFVRSLRLPANVDGSKVNASFKNGVLTVLLPKAAEARGMAIPIKID